METVWRVILFYGDFMTKLVWRLSRVFIEENMMNHNTRQSDFTIKSIPLHTKVSIISTHIISTYHGDDLITMVRCFLYPAKNINY